MTVAWLAASATMRRRGYVTVGRSAAVVAKSTRIGVSATAPRGTWMNAPSRTNAVLSATNGWSRPACRPRCASTSAGWVRTASARLPAVTPAGSPSVDDSAGAKCPSRNTSRAQPSYT